MCMRITLFPEIPKRHDGTTMKKQINPPIKAHLLWSALILLSLLAICAIPFAVAQRTAAKPSVTKPATQPIPFTTADPWETAQKLANGVHKVTSPSFVFTVTNTNDSGPGSLRQAIMDANVAGGRSHSIFPARASTQSVLLLPCQRLRPRPAW